MKKLKDLFKEKYLVMGEGKSKEDSIKIIENDIPRTFSKDHLFSKTGAFTENLRQILEAFAMYRPDIGYVQGMSYIGGICLINT